MVCPIADCWPIRRGGSASTGTRFGNNCPAELATLYYCGMTTAQLLKQCMPEGLTEEQAQAWLLDQLTERDGRIWMTDPPPELSRQPQGGRHLVNRQFE
jgi:hypothetical protein